MRQGLKNKNNTHTQKQSNKILKIIYFYLPLFSVYCGIVKPYTLRTLQGDGLVAFVAGHRAKEAGRWWKWRGVVAGTKGISSPFKTAETRSTLLCHLTPGAQYHC